MRGNPDKRKPFTKNDPRINKAGRPKKIPDLDALLAEQADDKAWKEILVGLVKRAKAFGKSKTATDLRAIEVLRNGQFGMPKQKSEVENTGVVTINFIPDGNKHSDKKPT